MAIILVATPQNVDFGNVKIGQSKTMDVELSAGGIFVPTITAANIEGHDDFTGGTAEECDYPATLSRGKIWTTYDTSLEPRIDFGCVKMGEYIYVVGGKKDDQYPEIIYNDCRRSQDGITWETMCSSCFDVGRSDMALFSLNGKLYMVGGLKNGIATNEVWVSENMGAQWVLCGNTEEPVAKMSYCQSETVLYYFGGINEVGALVNIIVRSVDGIDWSDFYVAAAVSARSNAAMTCDGTNIYIACGFDGTDLIGDFTWKAIDNDLESWYGVANPFSVSAAREGVAAISIGTYIIFHGGSNSHNAISSLSDIRYSGNDGVSWGTIGNTNLRRSFHSVVLLDNGKIIVIGGIGGEEIPT